MIGYDELAATQIASADEVGDDGEGVADVLTRLGVDPTAVARVAIENGMTAARETRAETRFAFAFAAVFASGFELGLRVGRGNHDGGGENDDGRA